MGLRVCVYAVLRDEVADVDRFMASAGSADAVVVLATAGETPTADALRGRGALVVPAAVEPWRWDVARNAALARCPANCDLLVALDLDAAFDEADWVERLRLAWPGHDRGSCRTVAGSRADGSDGDRSVETPFHTRHHRWELPLHERLRRREECPGADRWVALGLTLRRQGGQPAPTPERLALSHLAVAEAPLDAAVACAHAHELVRHERLDEARAAFARHLELCPPSRAAERAASMSAVAICHERVRADEAAEAWHLRACGEATHCREPFVAAARFYVSRDRFPMAWALAKRALQIDPARDDSPVITPYAQIEGPYDLAATAGFYLGQKAESLAFARKACELAPWDGRLRTNLTVVERHAAEVVRRFQPPAVVRHQPWTDDPSFGLVVGTYGSAPYVHLALAVRERHYPQVPMLVVDDGSPQREALAALCARYGAEFHHNEERMNHSRGDLLACVRGLRWAKSRGLDVLVKMSRRFVPLTDFRPSLREVIAQTQHATYSGVEDPTWGLRTECIAFHVDEWEPQAAALERLAREAEWLWVEKVVHEQAIAVLPWGVGGHDGAAVWEFPGLGKWVKADTCLWHDTADPGDYARLARSLGLDYRDEDFRPSG